MNPDHTRFEPLGIEVEFHKSDHCLVAHIPSKHGGTVYWLASDDFTGEEMGTWPRIDRAILRALLTEALRRLHESEPVNATGAAR